MHASALVRFWRIKSKQLNMTQQFPHNVLTKQDLLNHLENVLEGIKTDNEFLKSYPVGINAVIDAHGYHTDYW